MRSEYREREREREMCRDAGQRHTDYAKKNLGLSESTGSLVPIFEHLEHGSHLSTGIHRLVLDDHKLVSRRTVNLDDPVLRIGRVGGHDVEPRLVLIQYELVECQTRDRGTTTARRRLWSLLVLML